MGRAARALPNPEVLLLEQPSCDPESKNALHLSPLPLNPLLGGGFFKVHGKSVGV